MRERKQSFWSGAIRSVKRWFSHPWYPIVFSAYPTLALLAYNIGQIKLEAGWRPLMFSILFACLLYILLGLILRDRYRAAFLSMLWMMLFFSYGHLYIYLLDTWEEINFTPWLLIGWLILAVLSAVWAMRPGISFVGSVLPLNVITVGLAVTSLVQISFGVQKGGVHSLGVENAPVQKLARPQNPPDVYYFILDSYARADLLKSAYGYDNGEFIDALRERGFYVAECSQSNYLRTEISVGSSLNMSYLQELDPSFVPENIGRRKLWNALKHSAVRYNFEDMGYKTISFATGFAWSELDDADIFFTPPPFSAGLTEFEALFLRTTLARHVQDLGWLDMDEAQGQNFRDRTLLVFNRMDDVARMPGPTFSYIHVILPHPPFVFGPNGEHTHPAGFWNENQRYPPDLYAKGYQNQLTFLNAKMLEAIDTLITESDVPPIIVLQGDHGPWLQSADRRFWVLNAYYLPGYHGELYPQISPVNTFRLIFDAYFGGNYDMLPDVTYFSPVPNLYDFSEVPNNCK